MKILLPGGVQEQWLVKEVGVALLVSKNHLLNTQLQDFIGSEQLARLSYK